VRTEALVALILALIPVQSGGQLAGQPPSTPAVLAGIVVDAQSGAPVEGALVSTHRLTGNPNMRRAITDADGHFVILDIQPSRREVLVEASGFEPSRYGQIKAGGSGQQIELASGQTLASTKLSLWKQGVLSGSVTDEAGEPVVSVAVQAWRRQADARGFGRLVLSRMAMGTTDDRGKFRLQVPSGDYVVVVPATKFSTMWAQNRAGVAATTGPTLVAGDLLVRFDDAGTSRPNPPPATLKLLAYTTSFFPAATAAGPTDTVRVEPGQETPGIGLRTAVAEGVRISGTVSGSEPLAEMRIEARPIWADQFAGAGQDISVTAEGIVDSQGRFVLVGVPPGRYSLRAIQPRAARTVGTAIESSSGQALSMGTLGASSTAADGRTVWAEAAVDVAGKELNGVSLTLQRGFRVTGKVTFDGTPPPQPNDLQRMTLSLIPVVQGPWAVPASNVRTDGSFATGEYPPGRYQFTVGTSPTGWTLNSATSDGRDITDRSFVLTEDLASVNVVFTRLVSTVRGVVRNALQQVDSEAAVLVFPTDYRMRLGDTVRPIRVQRTRTSLQGEYSFSPLPAGDYFLLAVAEQQLDDSWQSASWIDARVAKAVRVRVEPGASVVQDLSVQAGR